MKVTRIDFSNPVNFGGTLHSISTTVTGARPGETPAKLSIDYEKCVCALTKSISGRERTILVPFANVSAMHVEEEPAEAKAVKK